jgi:hypothetical protein
VWGRKVGGRCAKPRVGKSQAVLSNGLSQTVSARGSKLGCSTDSLGPGNPRADYPWTPLGPDRVDYGYLGPIGPCGHGQQGQELQITAGNPRSGGCVQSENVF